MKTPNNMTTTGLLRVQRKYAEPATTAGAFILAAATAELSKRDEELSEGSSEVNLDDALVDISLDIETMEAFI